MDFVRVDVCGEQHRTRAELSLMCNSPPQPVIDSQVVSLFAGGEVLLDGRQSVDPDDTDLTFSWCLVSAPVAPASGESDDDLARRLLSVRTGVNGVIDEGYAMLRPPVSGTYVVQVVVSDGCNVSPTNVTIRAHVTPPQDCRLSVDAKIGTQPSLLWPTDAVSVTLSVEVDNKVQTSCLPPTYSVTAAQNLNLRYSPVVERDGVTVTLNSSEVPLPPAADGAPADRAAPGCTWPGASHPSPLAAYDDGSCSCDGSTYQLALHADADDHVVRMAAADSSRTYVSGDTQVLEFFNTSVFPAPTTTATSSTCDQWASDVVTLDQRKVFGEESRGGLLAFANWTVTSANTTTTSWEAKVTTSDVRYRGDTVLCTIATPLTLGAGGASVVVTRGALAPSTEAAPPPPRDCLGLYTFTVSQEPPASLPTCAAATDTARAAILCPRSLVVSLTGPTVAMWNATAWDEEPAGGHDPDGFTWVPLLPSGGEGGDDTSATASYSLGILSQPGPTQFHGASDDLYPLAQTFLNITANPMAAALLPSRGGGAYQIAFFADDSCNVPPSADTVTTVVRCPPIAANVSLGAPGLFTVSGHSPRFPVGVRILTRAAFMGDAIPQGAFLDAPGVGAVGAECTFYQSPSAPAVPDDFGFQLTVGGQYVFEATVFDGCSSKSFTLETFVNCNSTRPAFSLATPSLTLHRDTATPAKWFLDVATLPLTVTAGRPNRTALFMVAAPPGAVGLYNDARLPAGLQLCGNATDGPVEVGVLAPASSEGGAAPLRVWAAPNATEGLEPLELTVPGEYTFRIQSDDGCAAATEELRVTVDAACGTPPAFVCASDLTTVDSLPDGASCGGPGRSGNVAPLGHEVGSPATSSAAVFSCLTHQFGMASVGVLAGADTYPFTVRHTVAAPRGSWYAVAHVALELRWTVLLGQGLDTELLTGVNGDFSGLEAHLCGHFVDAFAASTDVNPTRVACNASAVPVGPFVPTGFGRVFDVGAIFTVARPPTVGLFHNEPSPFSTQAQEVPPLSTYTAAVSQLGASGEVFRSLSVAVGGDYVSATSPVAPCTTVRAGTVTVLPPPPPPPLDVEVLPGPAAQSTLLFQPDAPGQYNVTVDLLACTLNNVTASKSYVVHVAGAESCTVTPAALSVSVEDGGGPSASSITRSWSLREQSFGAEFSFHGAVLTGYSRREYPVTSYAINCNNVASCDNTPAEREVFPQDTNPIWMRLPLSPHPGTGGATLELNAATTNPAAGALHVGCLPSDTPSSSTDISAVNFFAVVLPTAELSALVMPPFCAQSDLVVVLNANRWVHGSGESLVWNFAPPAVTVHPDNLPAPQACSVGYGFVAGTDAAAEYEPSLQSTLATLGVGANLSELPAGFSTDVPGVPVRFAVTQPSPPWAYADGACPATVALSAANVAATFRCNFTAAGVTFKPPARSTFENNFLVYSVVSLEVEVPDWSPADNTLGQVEALFEVTAAPEESSFNALKVFDANASPAEAADSVYVMWHEYNVTSGFVDEAYNTTAWRRVESSRAANRSSARAFLPTSGDFMTAAIQPDITGSYAVTAWVSDGCVQVPVSQVVEAEPCGGVELAIAGGPVIVGQDLSTPGVNRVMVEATANGQRFVSLVEPRLAAIAFNVTSFPPGAERPVLETGSGGDTLWASFVPTGPGNFTISLSVRTDCDPRPVTASVTVVVPCTPPSVAPPAVTLAEAGLEDGLSATAALTAVLRPNIEGNDRLFVFVGDAGAGYGFWDPSSYGFAPLPPHTVRVVAVEPSVLLPAVGVPHVVNVTVAVGGSARLPDGTLNPSYHLPSDAASLEVFLDGPCKCVEVSVVDGGMGVVACVVDCTTSVPAVTAVVASVNGIRSDLDALVAAPTLSFELPVMLSATPVSTVGGRITLTGRRLGASLPPAQWLPAESFATIEGVGACGDVEVVGVDADGNETVTCVAPPGFGVDVAVTFTVALARPAAPENGTSPGTAFVTSPAASIISYSQPEVVGVTPGHGPASGGYDVMLHVANLGPAAAAGTAAGVGLWVAGQATAFEVVANESPTAPAILKFVMPGGCGDAVPVVVTRVPAVTAVDLGNVPASRVAHFNYHDPEVTCVGEPYAAAESTGCSRVILTGKNLAPAGGGGFVNVTLWRGTTLAGSCDAVDVPDGQDFSQISCSLSSGVGPGDAIVVTTRCGEDNAGQAGGAPTLPSSVTIPFCAASVDVSGREEQTFNAATQSSLEAAGELATSTPSWAEQPLTNTGLLVGLVVVLGIAVVVGVVAAFAWKKCAAGGEKRTNRVESWRGKAAAARSVTNPIGVTRRASAAPVVQRVELSSLQGEEK